MSREVTHTATGPRRVTADDCHPEYGDVAVCLCGLSDDYPFCDGSHRATEDEDPNARYRYVDGDRRRIESVRFVDETPGEEQHPGGSGPDAGTSGSSDGGDTDGTVDESGGSG